MQSRYYDPIIKRFINADGYVNANGDILGFNMYAYCGNNPVMGYDPTGEFLISAIIIGGAIGGILGAANSIISQYFDNGGDMDNVNWRKVGFDGVVGAVSGALASSEISLAGSAISGVVIGAVSSVINDLRFSEDVQNENGEYNFGKIAFNALNNTATGVVSGFISGAGADYIKDGQQVTKFVLSKGVLNRTIANNTQRAISRQTSAMYSHAQKLVVSGARYLAASAFNLIVPQIF